VRPAMRGPQGRRAVQAAGRRESRRPAAARHRRPRCAPGSSAGGGGGVGWAYRRGRRVSGRLRSYSQVAEDTADRDLVLRAPIKVRPRGATEAREVPNVTWMTISARHIVTMAVTYVGRVP